MDKLNLKIADRQRALDNAKASSDRAMQAMEDAARVFEDAQSRVKDLEIELMALIEADKLRPVGSGAGVDGAASALQTRRRGRQPGSISIRWREALTDFVAAGNNPVEMNRFYLMTRARLGLAESSVRERVRQYVSTGILTEDDGMISVSRMAIDKFRLTAASTVKAATASESARSM